MRWVILGSRLLLLTGAMAGLAACRGFFRGMTGGG